MILIAFALVCLLTVPLTGGKLSRLADVHVRGAWIPVTALAVQVVIVTIAPGGNPALHKALHVATYALIAMFLWANRHQPGVRVIAAGAFLNAVTIVANGGEMPASATAQRLAGIHEGTGFHNSVSMAHSVLPWLGDVIPWPGPLPNVLSVGDCIIYAGTLVLLHRLCGRRAPDLIRLSPIPEPSPTAASA
jgi:hypothetical protein